ncbi:hypothetical protein FHW19_004613, partial [Ochrobactrum anthropi]|nr:hypothetical protein [Brucella anthropi]
CYSIRPTRRELHQHGSYCYRKILAQIRPRRLTFVNIHHQGQKGLALIKGINFTILGGESMVKLPLKALLCTSCVVLGMAGQVSAGGLERGGYT